MGNWKLTMFQEPTALTRDVLKEMRTGKPAGLSLAEREIMRRHPGDGHDMLVAQGGFAPLVLTAVLSHHEYLDGSGYPQILFTGQSAGAKNCSAYTAPTRPRVPASHA